MAKKLFVGNINWKAWKEDLEDIFSKIWELEEVVLIKDETGRSKGFGFVTFVNDSDADTAISEFDGFEIDGRKIFVNEARPQEKKERRFDRR
jgi:RNA recognition motif-containing protein